MTNLPSKTEQKLKAQEMLMHGIATVLGYWQESNPNPFAKSAQDAQGDWKMAEPLTEEERREFGLMLQREGDRIAKLMGYDRAWSA